MTILVTGSSGHLGANLVRRLLKDNHSVRVLLREESNNSAVDGLEVEKVYGDLRDLSSVVAAVKGCDRIYHTAAKISTIYGDANFQQELYDCNVLGTRNILRAALETGVKRVVVTSSSAALGYKPGEPSNENTPFYPFNPTLPYEFTKVFVEHEALKAFADGLDVVIVQSWAIIGPNDFKPSRMGQILLDFANGKLPAYTTGGRDWVATKDLVNAHILAMEKGRSGQTYTISSEYLTLPEMMVIFEKVTGRKRPMLCLPIGLMASIGKVLDMIISPIAPNAPRYITAGGLKLLATNQTADCSKAKTELGYQPTSIEQAVIEAYQDFVHRGLIKNPKGVISLNPTPSQPTTTLVGSK
ncbi:SDR family oxidoreductase [Nostoc sp. CENA67]|uniref:SDR family oxidoreductase n=1 Tax=Amazonocrinis nigriterrae CENA67 TaxID=2794033 RepID=A0A8J7L729_9NOST|nr:SDR family oxidoreductase [Amazonocrinis nigriterrae]MBH8561908.1 SDR family oxidoreductase [Amazonocrinis nigriterrae CENA67]